MRKMISMMRNWKSLRLALAASLLLLFGGGNANAASVMLTIDGEFTVVPAGLAAFVPVGSTLSIDILLDDAEPNLTSSPDYNALNVGTLSSFLIVPVDGTVDEVSLANPAGPFVGWVGDMTLNVAPLGQLWPMTATIIGTGYTPGQILPDFSTLTVGEISIDASAYVPGDFLADVTGITISPVPEPSTALLLGLGLVVIAERRRRLA